MVGPAKVRPPPWRAPIERARELRAAFVRPCVRVGKPIHMEKREAGYVQPSVSKRSSEFRTKCKPFLPADRSARRRIVMSYGKGCRVL